MKVAEAWRFPELCKQVKRKCALLFQQKLRALLQEYLVTGEECSNSAEKQKRDTSRGVPKCSNTRVTGVRCAEAIWIACFRAHFLLKIFSLLRRLPQAFRV